MNLISTTKHYDTTKRLYAKYLNFAKKHSIKIISTQINNNEYKLIVFNRELDEYNLIFIKPLNTIFKSKVITKKY